ncbi:MAG: type II secretion system F family protein [Desulfovibrionaceae bacterium]|nr:type II secretion system F family protein [Desulfovibrionaceae bacterium]
MFDRLSLLPARLAFSDRARERCWKKVGRQIAGARLPLEQCFSLLERRAREDRSPVALAYADIAERLASGASVGAAVAPWAGPEEVMLLDAGQAAGEAGLAKGFARAAELMAKRREVRGLLSRHLAYPMALLGCVAGFLVMISFVLVPKLAALSDPSLWQGPAAVLHAVASFTASWKGAVTALLLAAGALAATLSLPRWTGRGRRFADHLPPWSVYRLLAGVGWLHAAAMLLAAGDMKLAAILSAMLARPETSPYLRWRLLPVFDAVSQGRTLGEALCLAPDRWPDRHMADDLRVYSALPGFNALLSGIAEELVQEGVERVQRQAGRLGAFALVLVVAVLCLLVTGLFGIQEQITTAVGAVGGL